MVQSPLRLGSVLLAALVLSLGLGACGGDDSDDQEQTTPPTPSVQDFPSPAGKTWEQLKSELGPGPVMAPAVADLEAGKKNRFGFGLFTSARKQIADAPAAIYLSPVDGGDILGPFPARFESLKTDGRYKSQTVSEDPDAAESVYVADIPFEKAGSYDAIAAVRLDDRLTAATLAGPALKVQKDDPVPEVGEKAINIHTETESDVGSIDKIDTRVPPAPELHQVDFADVLGKKPIVLLFATPALCQSRVCGPVEDVTLQVEKKYGDKVAWVHQEIYNDNEIEQGFQKNVLAWNLPTEPWVFIIDKNGKVSGRIEGAFSVKELEAQVAKVLKG